VWQASVFLQSVPCSGLLVWDKSALAKFFFHFLFKSRYHFSQTILFLSLTFYETWRLPIPGAITRALRRLSWPDQSGEYWTEQCMNSNLTQAVRYVSCQGPSVRLDGDILYGSRFYSMFYRLDYELRENIHYHRSELQQRTHLQNINMRISMHQCFIFIYLFISGLLILSVAITFPNTRKINKWWIGRIWEEAVMAYFKVIS
jgi:hypothetical protein